jgi:hypothetical protein
VRPPLDEVAGTRVVEVVEADLEGAGIQTAHGRAHVTHGFHPMDADTYAEAQKAFDTVTARLPK